MRVWCGSFKRVLHIKAPCNIMRWCNQWLQPVRYTRLQQLYCRLRVLQVTEEQLQRLQLTSLHAVIWQCGIAAAYATGCSAASCLQECSGLWC